MVGSYDFEERRSDRKEIQTHTMKRYGYLYDGICDPENIKLAIKFASRGKRKRSDVKRVLRDIDNKAIELSEMLKSGGYNPSPYTAGKIIGGTNRKERDILKPKFFPDQCVHWAIYLQIAPILQKSFYTLSCGSVPGRGPHYGKRHVEKWVRNDRKHTKYYLKMDIHHFYPSLDPELIKKTLRRKFKDKDLLNMLDKILDMHTGLPIGILLSQWFANYMLTPLDNLIKQDLKAPYYIRYMDDMVVFGSNKRELHKMKIEIETWLNQNGLELKGNWQVCRFDKEPLDFMGFRFYRDRTILRKSIMYQITKLVRKIRKRGVNYRRACGIISYMGYIKCTDSRNLFTERIQPYVNFKMMKQIIRRNTKNDYYEI